MTLEYLLLCLLISHYRDEISGMFQRKEEEPDDYWSEVREALICDAPKPRRHLRVIK